MGIFDGLKLGQDDEEEKGGGGIFSGLDLGGGPPGPGAEGLDLGPAREVKPLQVGVESGTKRPGEATRVEAGKKVPTAQRLKEGAGIAAGGLANIFEGVSVGLEKVPVVGPAVVQTAKTTLAAPGALSGVAIGAHADPEAWTQAYDEGKAALAARLGKAPEELNFGELIRAMPSVSQALQAQDLQTDDIDAIASASKVPQGRVAQLARDTALVAMGLGVDIATDPTTYLTGGAKQGLALGKYAATGKAAAGMEGVSRAQAGVQAIERILGSPAAGAVYGPEVIEGVLRGVESGDIPQVLGSSLIGGLMVKGVRDEFQSQHGRAPTEAELEAAIRKIHDEALAEGRAPERWGGPPPAGHELAWQDESPASFRSPAEVRADMMMLEGTPAVERRGWAEALPATEVGPVKPVESYYEQAKKSEAGAKARWDDVLELAEQEQAALPEVPREDPGLEGVDFTLGVTPIEEALVRERRGGDGDRRVLEAKVEHERRVGARRDTHAKLVASETGLPEDSPAVQRIVEGEIDPQTGLFGAVMWERELAKLPEGAGVAVSDMGGTKWLNDTFGHANGDRFIEAQGLALMEAAEEINRKYAGADARGFRPHQKGDELGTLASTPEYARMTHALAQEKFAEKQIELELSDGTRVTYQGGTLDFYHGERARGEDPHAAYKRVDELLEQHRKALIARGERAPRGTRPLDLRAVEPAGEVRAGAPPEPPPSRAEALPGEPPPGSEGLEGADLVERGGPPEAPPDPTPPIHSHLHVGYGGEYEYFVRADPGQEKPQVYRARKDAAIDRFTGQREGAEWVGPADGDTQKRILAEARADAAARDEGPLRGEMRVPKASMASGSGGSRQGRVAAEVVDQVREERTARRAELYGRGGEAAPAEPPSAPPPRDPGAPPEAPPPGGEPPPEAGGPPSAPIPYPKYARPSSINLWQRIDHGEDALDLFVETAAQFEGLVEEAKRGTMTLAQIKQLATNLGSSEEAVERALSKRPGTALNAEKLWAVNEGLKETARATVEHARAFAATPALERSPQMEADLLAQLARHTAVFASVSGANSEAGRALGVLNRIRKSADLQAVIDTYGRSTQDAKQTLGVIADLLAKIPADDVRALGKFVREVSKPTFTSKVYEYWINAILSGPPTHVSNAISGVLGSILYPAELAMGAGFDAARYSVDHLVRGEAAAPRTIFFREAAEAGKQLLGALDAPLKVAETLGLAKRKITAEDIPAVAFNRGLREALDVAMQAWRTESSVVGETSRVREMQPRGGAIEGRLGRGVRTPTRLLQATDQFFQALIYRMSLNAQAMNQALREGHSTRLEIADRMGHLLQNPDQITRDKAVAEAAYRTFNNEPGKAGQALLRFRRDVPLMGWIVPFLTTPINIVKFGGERTPGVTAYTLGKAITEYAQGKITARDLGEEGARFLVSSAALLGVAYLAANGQISGAGPKDPAERRTLEATGWRPYSIKLGEDWYGYSRIEPLGLTLRMTADYIEAWQRGDKSAEEFAPQLIHAASRNLLDLPMISGLSGLFKTMMDYERYGTGWATRTASSFLPALLGYGKRAANPERRLPQTFTEGVAQKLPGAGKLAALVGEEDPGEFARALDIYGRAELLEDTWWERFASPLRRSTVRSDQVTPHLIRLGINLGSPSKKLEDWIDPATRKPLPQPEGRDAEVLAQARGIARYALASVVVTQQDFRLAPEDVQREVLRRYLEKGSMVVTRRAKGLLRQGQRLTLQDLVGELLEKGPPALQ